MKLNCIYLIIFEVHHNFSNVFSSTSEALISNLIYIDEGDLKRVVCQDIGLEPKDQRLFFRGKEKEDQECLQMAGLKDNSKLLLMENLACKERKLEEVKESCVISKGSEAVAKVRAENDKLAEQVYCVHIYIYLYT